MSNKRGFSLLETIIVAAVIAVALTAAITLRSGSESTSRKIAEQEECYNLQARLMLVLKNDLRSAVAIKNNADGSFSLDCLKRSPENGAVQKYSAVYRLSGPKNERVERIIDGRSDKTWDFSSFAEGRKFKLAISVIE